jgi:hypothetical protein
LDAFRKGRVRHVSDVIAFLVAYFYEQEGTPASRDTLVHLIGQCKAACTRQSHCQNERFAHEKVNCKAWKR